MKKTIKHSPAPSLNADAQRQIRAEAVRHLKLTGAVLTEDKALELIVLEHAKLHSLIVDCVNDIAPYVVNVKALIEAVEEDTLRLVDSDEDTSHVQFRFGVLEVLQDPEAIQSAVALHSRIGALGVAKGWWKKREAA